MKHVIVVLYFLTSSALLYAEEVKLKPEFVKLFQDSPKLAQNLRKFDTLSMEISKESFVDGKWKLMASHKIVADFRKNILRSKKVREEEDSLGMRYRTYYENSENTQTGKEITLDAKLEETEKNVFSPKKITEARAYISRGIGSPYGICNERMSYLWHEFFLYFDSTMPMQWRTVLELIQDPVFQKARNIKIKQLDHNTVLLDAGTKYFIDLSKGMPFKRVDLVDDGDGEKECVAEITEFTLKDGRLFPTATLYTENGKPISREKINPKTLKIDQPLSPNDFAVKIYPGTKVLDKIENREYIAKQEMTSADIRELERQIVNLVGEVQKHREKSKNEAKAKKEQQEKEKQ